jgi:hypothetical protein
LSAANWPPGTVVDDAVQLSLPEGEADGAYQLAVGLVADAATTVAAPPVVIGRLPVMREQDAPPTPHQLVTATLGDSIHLVGADYAVAGNWSASTATTPLRLKPGETFAVRLYWRTNASLTADLHGFVHLVDAQGNVIAQQDQAPGLDFQPSSLWLPGNTVLDEYQIVIPADTPSTVLWPRVGLYNVVTQERLVSRGADGAAVDVIQLAPIKVVGKPQDGIAQTTAVQFGEVATLVGFTVDAPAQGVQPGAGITVRLAFQSLTPTVTNFTRFVHLYSPTLGMAGQADGAPQAGNNPTWAWAPGEVIEEAVVIPLHADAPPGEYTLSVGFYDPQANGQRLPVTDRGGALLPDNLAPLTTLVVRND